MQIIPPAGPTELGPADDLPKLDAAPLKRGLRQVAEIALAVFGIWLAWTLTFGDATPEGSAMAPGIAADQRILASRISYLLAPPKRNEIAAIQTLERPVLRRVVALPGDQVELRGVQVLVNGIAVNDPGLGLINPNATATRDQLFQLRPGQYFVVTDIAPFYASTQELRQRGVISETQLIGRAWLSYWPPDALGFVKQDAP